MAPEDYDFKEEGDDEQLYRELVRAGIINLDERTGQDDD